MRTNTRPAIRNAVVGILGKPVYAKQHLRAIGKRRLPVGKPNRKYLYDLRFINNLDLTFLTSEY
jgi:hypothetical protein